jgi:hypothetical protein
MKLAQYFADMHFDSYLLKAQRSSDRFVAISLYQEIQDFHFSIS